MIAAIHLCTVLLTALLIGIYRRGATRFGWIDKPNSRSSHSIPTPRGAGIVVALLIGVGILLWLRDADTSIRNSLLACLGIAAIGWADDIRSLSAKRRLLLYALVVVVALIAAPPLLSAADSYQRALLLLAMLLGLLWLINLYNFMDGINGIAGFEALFVLIAVLMLSDGSDYGARFANLLLGSACVIGGFLLWNFPGGKVFLGDSGSAFLGVFIGLLMLWSQLLDGPSIAVWLILLGVFVVDASYTLLVRFSTGQAWHEGHRLHAYQILNSRWRSHGRTLGAVMAMNIFWLLPWAYMLQHSIVAPPYAIGIAFLPVALICRGLKAGIPRSTRV